jgi:hypothetical protein
MILLWITHEEDCKVEQDNLPIMDEWLNNQPKINKKLVWGKQTSEKLRRGVRPLPNIIGANCRYKKVLA